MASPGRPQLRIGLPSNPAPRSRSTSRRETREDLPRPPSRADEFVPYRAAPPPPPVPELRQPRSMTNLRAAPAPSRSRSLDGRRNRRTASPAPPLPIAPVPVRRADYNYGTRQMESPPSSFVPPRKRSEGSVTSWGSTSSGFSQSSQNSLLSNISYASSRTSFHDDDKPTSPINEGEKRGYSSPKDPGVADSPGSPDSKSPRSSNGFGSTLWNRVAAAASNLRVNATRVIGNAPFVDSEPPETPLGQESSLTRAMKAYHVEKARDASDLPDWLFDGKDREIIDRLRGRPPQQSDDDPIQRAATVSPTSRPTRAPFRTLGETGPTPAWRPGHSRSSSSSSVHAAVPSRDTMNRLKEIRLAKRNARVRFAGHDDEEDNDTLDVKPTKRSVTPPPPLRRSRSPTEEPSTLESGDGKSPLRRRPTGYLPPTHPQRQPSTRVGLPTSVRPQRL